ncbi:ras-related protein rab-39b-like [Willisornis vidua]|uniref:Ras-related protein rab-39b-like n=1 Tax=Willisornis vidua TaxID=1566151 RepID=A0ABQ9DRC6_9PASS|nr:ras-related protein rab-39b-like [Willisornis vidua]
MEPRWQYQFRVIMLGDSTVGKSSLLRRYTEDTFLDAVNQTVGVDFYVQFVELEPGLRVKLQFWDTAGQERFSPGEVLDGVVFPLVSFMGEPHV